MKIIRIDLIVGHRSSSSRNVSRNPTSNAAPRTRTCKFCTLSNWICCMEAGTWLPRACSNDGNNLSCRIVWTECHRVSAYVRTSGAGLDIGRPRQEQYAGHDATASGGAPGRIEPPTSKLALPARRGLSIRTPHSGQQRHEDRREML
jgi:hypothetical protein